MRVAESRGVTLPILSLAQGYPLGVETIRDQLCYRRLHVSLVWHGQIYLPVQSKLRQGLPARPAWPNEPLSHVSSDGDSAEFPVSLGCCSADGSPLGADGEAI